MLRWSWSSDASFKVMVHHFLPNMRDIDPHDHPASFVTIVVRARYVDEQPCDCTRENSYGSLAEVYRQNDLTCPRCGGAEVIRQTVRAPSIHFRPATHAHMTETGTGARGPSSSWVRSDASGASGGRDAADGTQVDEYENEIGWHMRCADYDPTGVQS
jgi:hypothetical protein